jgi:hypothetical protein
MNAKEISPKANARLKRIRIVSRIAKYACLIFLVYSIWPLIRFWTPSALSLPKDNVEYVLLSMIFQIVLWIWYWKLSRLFNYYERGLIFAAETIRCIKIMGLMCLIGWMINSALHFLPPLVPHLQNSLPAPGRLAPIKTSSIYLRMGFFSFDFGTGINFGQLLIGAVIFLIAWIMDEGRKIQEEQELTV